MRIAEFPWSSYKDYSLPQVCEALLHNGDCHVSVPQLQSLMVWLLLSNTVMNIVGKELHNVCFSYLDAYSL